jgi:hypothetical protein
MTREGKVSRLCQVPHGRPNPIDRHHRPLPLHRIIIPEPRARVHLVSIVSYAPRSSTLPIVHHVLLEANGK